MERAQVQIAAALLLTAIIIVAVGAAFFWAKDLIERGNNFNDFERIKNRMLELHYAIKEVANEEGQRVVDFEIVNGRLYLVDNSSIKYELLRKLPKAKKGNITLLLGNSSSTGPCLSNASYGLLSIDEPACLKEQAGELELTYIPLNATGENKCYQIILQPGKNVAIGKGHHVVYIKFNETEEVSDVNCGTLVLKKVEINMK